jgi:regulator of cell morphogenesis and NO signaling
MTMATQTIREIISSHPTAAAILHRFDIDVCARSNEPLTEACADLQLCVEQVLEKLENGAATEAGAEPADPAGFPPSRLIQHIVRVHHQNVRQVLPKLAELAHTVAKKYGERAPELRQVEILVSNLHAELTEHIRKEEQVLFPYIVQVDEAPLLAFRPPQQCFSRVGQPVFMMAQEHERAKLIIADLRRLTDGFKPPVWACSTFVALYSGLRSASDDLKEHFRLENDVLFPRAIEMEAELMEAGVR